MSNSFIELPSINKGAVDANLSRFGTAVNDSILDNVVTRFSIVNNHKVRGRWRSSLAASVIVVPIIVFSVLLWYQLTKTCVVGTAAFPYTTNDKNSAEQLESVVAAFLAKNAVHFCMSTFTYTNADMYQDNSNNLVTQITADTQQCTIPGFPNKEAYTQYCKVYDQLFEYYTPAVDSTTGQTISCFEYYTNLSNVTIYFTQCIPWQTAFMNSIQCAVYSIVATIVVYLALRIWSKFGLCALFKPSKWLEMLQNNKPDWKTVDVESPMAYY